MSEPKHITEARILDAAAHLMKAAAALYCCNHAESYSLANHCLSVATQLAGDFEVTARAGSSDGYIKAHAAMYAHGLLTAAGHARFSDRQESIGLVDVARAALQQMKGGGL